MVFGLRLGVLVATVLVLLSSGEASADRVRKGWKLFSDKEKSM